MKLGTNEPKKVALLGALVLLIGYLVYSNLSGPSVPSAPRKTALPSAAESPAAPAAPSESGPPMPARAIGGRGRSDDFHPVLHSKRPEDRVDTTKIDPTLRLDLLAKLEQVELPSGGRNPFKMGPPPPPAQKPQDSLKGPEPIVKVGPVVKPVGPPPASERPAGPPPLQTGLKYYGYTSLPGAPTRTAFFLDGEDILVAKEGETVKHLYRVVKVGANAVLLEDPASKRQQSIPLTED